MYEKSFKIFIFTDVGALGSHQPPCDFNMSGFYNFLHTSFSGPLVDIMSLKSLYQMHGIIFEGNSAYGNMIVSNPSSNSFQLQPVSGSTTSIIQLIGATQSDITWQSGVSGNYYVQVSGYCINGTRSTGANASGSVAPGQQITSSIPLGDLQEGLNNIRVCVQSGSELEELDYSIRKDTTPPVVAITPASTSFSGTLPVSITCSDIGGSGCSQITYTKVDTHSLDQSAQVVNSSSTANIWVSCDTTINYYATDMAGNLSQPTA